MNFDKLKSLTLKLIPSDKSENEYKDNNEKVSLNNQLDFKGHVNTRWISDVIAIWQSFADIFESTELVFDWQDISSPGQDILKLGLRYSSIISLSLKLNLTFLVGEFSDNEVKSYSELEQRVLKEVAEQIVIKIDNLVSQEKTSYSFFTRYDLNGNERLNEFHVAESYLIRFAQVLHIISVEPDFRRHINNFNILASISVAHLKDFQENIHEIVNNNNLNLLSIKDHWIQNLDGSKDLIAINASFSRLNGQHILKITIYADDLNKYPARELIKKLLIEQINAFSLKMDFLSSKDFADDEYQRLIDDQKYFDAIKSQLRK